MKKLLLCALLFALMGAGNAIGGAMNQFRGVLLVPFVTFSTTTNDLSTMAVLSRYDGNLHWAFFDANGNRLASGQQVVQANHRTGFNWQTMAGASGVPGLDGTQGFLVFALDTNSDGKIDASDSDNGITGNAFLVNLINNDAAYIPTVGVAKTALSNATISSWTNNPITDINNPAQQAVEDGNTIMAEYLIDGTVGTGDNTFLVFWHTREVTAAQSGTLHDGAGSSKAITLQFLNDNLNVFDLEANADVTAGFFGDGFVNLAVPSDPGTTFMIGFSRIQSEFVGAEQTTMFNVLD